MLTCAGCATNSEAPVKLETEHARQGAEHAAPQRRGDTTQTVDARWETLGLWARPGQPLVVPIAAPSSQSIVDGWVPAGIGAWSGKAKLVRVRVRPADSPATRASARWLDGLVLGGAAGGEWSTESAKAATDGDETGGYAAWVGMVDVPADVPLKLGESSRAVYVDGRRVSVGWGEDPAPAAVGRVSGGDGAWGGTAGASAFEREAVAALRRSPLTRWQGRLCAGESVWATIAAPSDRFEDPVLEALARQIESRWHTALSAVREADADLEVRVRKMLGRMVTFGGGVRAPLPPDAEATARLLSVLDGQRGESAASAARAWLGERGRTAAWIMDDAPAKDGAGGGLVRVGVLNLSEQECAASVRAPSARAPEAIAIDPASAATMTLAFPAQAGTQEEMIRSENMITLPRAKSEQSVTTDIEVMMGEWRGTQRATPEGVRAKPPGVEVGPGVLDFSAAGLLSGINELDQGSRMTGRLTRDPQISGAAELREGWLVYVECQRSGADRAESNGAMKSADDRVALFFGPTERPLAVLTLMSDGRVFAGSGGTLSAEPISRVRVKSSETSWSASVPVPATAFESDGATKASLRLGIERVDERGVRTSWPRARLPWQSAPSRMLIDVSGWDSGK